MLSVSTHYVSGVIMNTNVQVRVISNHLPVDTAQHTTLFNNTNTKNADSNKHRLGSIYF
jgi:hypothetical protein